MNRLRDWLNNNPAVGAGIAGGLVVLAILVLISTRGGSGPGVTGEYYWNIDTGEIETVEGGNIPPIVNDRGQTLVRAVVVTCGRCRPRDWTVLRLERFPPHVRERIEQQMGDRAMEAWDETDDQDLLSRMEWLWDPEDNPDAVHDDRNWVYLGTGRAEQQQYEEHRRRWDALCGDDRPRRCYPGR